MAELKEVASILSLEAFMISYIVSFTNNRLLYFNKFISNICKMIYFNIFIVFLLQHIAVQTRRQDTFATIEEHNDYLRSQYLPNVHRLHFLARVMRNLKGGNVFLAVVEQRQVHQ